MQVQQVVLLTITNRSLLDIEINSSYSCKHIVWHKSIRYSFRKRIYWIGDLREMYLILLNHRAIRQFRTQHSKIVLAIRKKKKRLDV